MAKIQTILDMTLGELKTSTHEVPPMIPPILEIEDEAEDLVEIAAKKNRQRFAINKSYSIENGYKGNV